MPYDLGDKAILITGAASGIGRASATLLSESGAQLVLSDIDRDLGERLCTSVRENGGVADFVAADVTQRQEVEALVDFTVERHGRLDCAVNSAGIEHKNQRLTDCDEALFDRVIAVNLKGIFLCMHAQIRAMLPKGSGHIINLASIAGIKSAPSLACYSASKYGVVGISKSAAVEYAKNGIRINAVCPSFINTPMVQRSLDEMDAAAQERIIKANPMRRLGEPHEIASMIAWLCSDDSSFVTGQNLVLDGGMTA